MEQSGSPDRDAFERLGRSVRHVFFVVDAFIDALLDSEAWARFGRAVFKRSVVIIIIGMAFAGITWNYSTEIFHWLLVPAKGNLSPSGLPIFTAPQDMFGVTVNLALKGGMLAAFPVFVVSVYTLFSQWLPPQVRTFLKIFVPSVFLAFAGGVAFVYYVILSTSLTFLLGFGEGVANPYISVTNYFDMVLSLMFWMGVLFELPLAMYLLARTGLVSLRKLKLARLAVWFFAPILAAIITPSFDWLTWVLVMGPLLLLYEVGLFLAWLAKPDADNYLFARKIGRGLRAVLRGIRAIVMLPVRGLGFVTVKPWRWLRRRMRD